MYKFTIIIFLLSIFTGMGIPVCAQNPDINMLRNINQNSSPFLKNTSIAASHSVIVLGIGTPFVMGTVALIEKDDTLLKNTLYIGASYLSTFILTYGLKYTVGRKRPYDQYPDLIHNYNIEHSPSFPSSHTSMAFSLATSLSLKYPKWYIIAPGYLWACTVGYSRMNLGVHYPSDVLAGAILGAGSAYLTYKLNNWFWNKQNNRKIINNYAFL